MTDGNKNKPTSEDGTSEESVKLIVCIENDAFSGESVLPELISNQRLTDPVDPVQEIPKNRLERRDRLVRSLYQPELSKFPTTKIRSKFK